MSDQPEEAEVLLPSMPGGQPYDESGVDVTLIQMMLALTPSERLEMLRTAVESLARMRNAIITIRPTGNASSHSDA